MDRKVILGLAFALAAAGCSEDTPIQPGAVGWPCPNDNNCNGDLRCIAGFCAEDPGGNPTPDAGNEVPDAGEPDAGEPDAGEPDAGEPDAGEVDAGPVCDIPAQLSAIRSQVFGEEGQPACNQSFCHGGDGAGGIILSTPVPQLRQALLGPSVHNDVPQTQLVVPGNPDQSRLYVIMSNQNPGGSGGFMPPGNEPVDECAIQALRQWILDGALEN